MKEYCARFGVPSLTDEEYRAVSNALCDQRLCKNCSWQYCRKSFDEFLLPEITVVDGHVKVEKVRCQAWKYECKRLLKKTGIPARYASRTFDDYECTRDNSKALDVVRHFLTQKTERGVFIYGGAGTGKTFLASLIGVERVNAGRSVLFRDVPELLRELKLSFNSSEDSAEALIDRYSRVPLLILDDIGSGYMTEWAVSVLYMIINNRYNDYLPTIVTSNYDLTGLQERLTAYDTFGGERIVSRLREMCWQAYVGTHDRRR